jgi:serine/threonine protein kinase
MLVYTFGFCSSFVYISQHQSPSIHPSIHPSILSLDRQLIDRSTAQVSDFGLAGSVRNTNSVQPSKEGIGTVNWSAPEVGEKHYKPIPESDVWSLGMVTFEVASRRVPYEGMSVNQISRAHEKGELPDMDQIEAAAPGDLKKMILQCCTVEPVQRPLVSKVAADLKKLLADLRRADLQPSSRPAQHHEEIIQILEAIKEGQARAEKKLDTISTAVHQSLTMLLGVANDDCRYPRTFLVLPKKVLKQQGGGGSGGGGNRVTRRLRGVFETSDTFVVVFLCERTLAPIR